MGSEGERHERASEGGDVYLTSIILRLTRKVTVIKNLSKILNTEETLILRYHTNR